MNRLAGSTSPYLLQHKDNPVDWHVWGDEAFAKARAENKPIFRDRDGRLRVPGTMRLDDLGEQFHLDLEHEDVDSISGLVLTLLGRPAEVGDAVRYERLLIEVTAVKGHGVEQCAVSLAA